nr:ATP-binding protein [Candidatus Nitrospira inopinata]
MPELLSALAEAPAVCLIGPKQAGKTTLALAVAQQRRGLYLDLESEVDRAKLAEPVAYLERHLDQLVILDEVYRTPELFSLLRGLIDRARRKGRGTGRYLLLGSAALNLLRQSSESLAGRIRFLELTPFHLREPTQQTWETLWLRGGFPGSLLAADDAQSLRWRRDFLRTYLERDIPQFGRRIAAETLRRFWTMLAHRQGAPLNLAELARNLGVDTRTVAHYVDLLVDLLLVRRLPSWHANVGKRLVKTPRLFLRDSGLVHALLGIQDLDSLLAHPGSELVGRALSSKTCWSRHPRAHTPPTGAPVGAPKSICCWNCQSASAGRSRSNAAWPRHRAETSIRPATISSRSTALSCIQVQNAFPFGPVPRQFHR